MVTTTMGSNSTPCSSVLSPPCGMVTELVWVFPNLFKDCSKPTVWDGDKYEKYFAKKEEIGSKPTVWDGDEGFFHPLTPPISGF